MKLSFESRQTAELLGIKVRWALIASAAILLLEPLNNPLVSGVLALFAVTNVLAHRLCKSLASYELRGMALMQGLRCADAAVIVALGIAIPSLRSTNLWLLVVPTILTECLISREKRPVAILSALSLGSAIASWSLSNVSWVVLAGPGVGIVASALLGLALSRYKSRDELLTSHDHRLSTILDCGSALAASTDLRSTILHTLRSTVVEAGASCGYVMLLDEDNPTTLRTEVAYGMEGDFEFPRQLEVGMGMSGYVAKMGQPVSISSSKEATEEYDGVTSGVSSAICVPLIARTYHTSQSSSEQVLGVITVLSLASTDAFDNDDLEMLRTVGSLIAVAVANARMEERQRSTFVRTLESLATALEARDEYTRGHSQRVCEVSMMIGERMGLSLEALEELRVGTILHDIGKIGVPDAILNKKDRLTDEEFTVMKSHPVIGYEICKPLRLSEGILLIIRNHHEKLDGSGYPDGLRGGELPLSLRVVCVADAFDAMSSKRPYRGVMEMHAVMAELSRCAGTQFDPVVVESLKDLIKSERMQELYKSYWGPRHAEAA